MISPLSAPNPRITVILPVYNAAVFLAATLDSILQQSYSDFEVIAVDDGSNDDSAMILATYAKQDRRLRVITQPNQGVATARNVGIAQAQAALIAPIDADDLWHPDFLAQHLARHTQTPDLAVSYCWSVDIDPQNRWIGGFQASPLEGWVHDTMLCHYFLGNGSCSVIRRDLLQAIQGYRTCFGNSAAGDSMGQAVCEDWDLYLRLATQGHFGVVPQFLVGYRKHAASTSHTTERMRYWHRQLLAARQRDLSHIRPWIYQLSIRSFERYLQRQAAPPPPRQLVFPQTNRWPWQTRLQRRRQLWLTQLLHWLVQIGGQRRDRPPAHPLQPDSPALHR